MAEILTVLTFKSVQHIVGDGGTQSWVISPSRARRCDYVVCVRHQHGPYKAEGNEPHKHAFLVGKVSDVVPSGEASDRYRVEFSEYAVIEGPQISLSSASPTQYFPSLSSIGIDAAALQWKPIGDATEDATAPPIVGPTTLLAREPVANGDNVAPPSVFMQAKMLVAAGLQVPLSAVEIIVRG